VSSATDSPKFTLRFHNTRSHEVLGLVAERYGKSKNQVALEMIERELQVAALGLELDLAGTLELLRNYNPDEHLERAIEDFAEGEGYGDDPIKTRMAEPLAESDAYGIAEAFAS